MQAILLLNFPIRVLFHREHSGLSFHVPYFFAMKIAVLKFFGAAQRLQGANMADDEEIAVVQAKTTKDDPTFKSIPKYKRSQNVDYKVTSCINFVNLTRTLRIKNYEETCKRCNNGSVK